MDQLSGVKAAPLYLSHGTTCPVSPAGKLGNTVVPVSIEIKPYEIRTEHSPKVG